MDYWWKPAQEAEKAALQAQARQRGDDEPNSQIRRLLEVLAQAEKLYSKAGNYPEDPLTRLMVPLFLIMIFPIFSYLVNVIFQLDWPFYYWVVLNVCLVAASISAFVKDFQLKDRMKREITERILHSGLIERLALGPAAFPNIYANTPWPWRLYLGSKPRTLPEHVRLVIHNVEWFLLDEPRSYVKPEWIIRTISYVPALVFWLTSMLINSRIYAFNPSTYLLVFHGIVLFSLLVFPVSWLGSYSAVRNRAAATALYQQCLERFGITEDPGGSPQTQ